MRVDGLSVRYGRFPAVEELSFEVGPGEIVGLVGESGSGKSTVAKALVGLVPHGGKVSGVRPGGIQMVFQDPYASLNPRMRVARSVAEGVRAGGSARAAEVRRLLALVGLDEDVGERYPRELSGGQRQRVALARALGARPEVLVADEVTSALDVSVQGAVLNLVKELRGELGLAVLFISHDLAVVRYVCDRVLVMRDGRIVEAGTVEQVMGSPGHEYTKALLGAVPRVP